MHITQRHYLIIDLEATCSSDAAIPRDQREIIEIGAVLQNARTFEIDSEFQTCVRPIRHPQLTDFCTQLTGITQSHIASAPTFPSALQQLNDWLAGFDDTLFCSWGDYDRSQLLQDCRFHEVPYPLSSQHLNLKSQFALTLGIRKEPGLPTALQRLSLTFQGTHHSGLDDARNMARIIRKLCTGTA
jgi:inhibitor of KinA sporulation pathway (predicted exonuclease)